MIAGIFSCNHDKKSSVDTAVQSQKQLTSEKAKNIFTKYEYADAIGKSLIIQNSFPKSGIHYTDPSGKKYIYAVFWTRIVNETDSPCELQLDFSLDSVEIPSASGNYIRLLVPSDTMTIQKEPLYNYGLSVKSFLDQNRHKSSTLKRTINPKESSAFYIVTLSDKGVNGTLRTGLSLKGQYLFYKINNKEIPCGKINLKKLIIRKQA